MRHDIESCDKGGEDQDMTWLDGLVASVTPSVLHCTIFAKHCMGILLVWECV